MRTLQTLTTQLMILALLTAPRMAAAQDPDIGNLQKAATDSLEALIKWMGGFAGAIVAIMLVLGGLQYIQGNPDGGKKTLTAAIIGAVIVVLGYFIVNTFYGFLLQSGATPTE